MVFILCYCPTPTLHLNLALTGDFAFLLSPQKTHSVWFISILKSGQTHTHTHTHLLTCPEFVTQIQTNFRICLYDSGVYSYCMSTEPKRISEQLSHFSLCHYSWEWTEPISKKNPALRFTLKTMILFLSSGPSFLSFFPMHPNALSFSLSLSH